MLGTIEGALKGRIVGMDEGVDDGDEFGLEIVVLANIKNAIKTNNCLTLPFQSGSRDISEFSRGDDYPDVRRLQLSMRT